MAPGMAEDWSTIYQYCFAVIAFMKGVLVFFEIRRYDKLYKSYKSH